MSHASWLPLAEGVVGVVEPRQDAAVRGEVHQVQQLARVVVGVRRVNAVAERLAGQPAGGIVNARAGEPLRADRRHAGAEPSERR